MATTRSLLAQSFCAIALVAMAACGSSNSPSASSSSPTPSPSPSPTLYTSVDACTLVTAADASTAAGITVTNMSSVGGIAIPGACFYGSADGKSTVMVFAQTYPDASSADSVSPEQLAATMNLAGAGATNAKTVSGVGDKAVEYSVTTSGSDGTAIFVFKANVVILIAVNPANSNTVEQLARTAVGHL